MMASTEAGTDLRVASTGKDAERAKTVPIRREPGKGEVVISLGPGDHEALSLPPVAPGDGLVVSAEIEVTTDCEQQQSDCVEKPYGYAPEVEATLLLADDRSAAESEKGHAIELARQSRRITHERHHDVFVFEDRAFEVPAEDLPWKGQSVVNVAITAHSPQAGDSHVVLIGQNEEGEVLGDMSAISVVRSRPAKIAQPELIREQRRLAEAIPVLKGETEVIYSHELKDLARGEQLIVKAEVVTSAEHLDCPARATVEVLLAEDPTRPEPGAEAKRITATDGRICPRNGKNCSRSESPMSSSKAGVLRIEQNARKPLHVIVVLETGDPTQKAKAGDELRIREGGSLRILRFPPADAGNGVDGA